MRTLKFRAWDDLNKKWLLGYEYPNLGGFSMIGEVMAFGEYERMLSSFKIEDWDKIILMQFTGLLDKNGKEIYEGDRDNAGNVVEYLNGCYCLNGDRPLSWMLGVFEVAGNIYENPL